MLADAARITCPMKILVLFTGIKSEGFLHAFAIVTLVLRGDIVVGPPTMPKYTRNKLKNK